MNDPGGPLNLLPGDGRPCSIHPNHAIGEDGCGACRHLHRMRARPSSMDPIKGEA